MQPSTDDSYRDSANESHPSANKKIALVTGGTSGVGLSILPDLVKAGFYVYFVGPIIEIIETVFFHFYNRSKEL